MLRTLLFTCLAIAAPAPQPAQHVKVPLSDRRVLVRASGDVDSRIILDRLKTALEKYNSRSDVPTYSTQGLEKRLSEESLMDQVESGPVDDLYYGPTTVGFSLPQGFQMDFDTGR